MFVFRSTAVWVILLGIGISSPVAAAGSQSLFKLPCTISYDGGASIATHCLVKNSASQGSVIERVQTPNGKIFILENDRVDHEKWYLDHKVAVKVSDEPDPCYQNEKLTLCF